jgi:phosphatidate cytidylyltransferase
MTSPAPSESPRAERQAPAKPEPARSNLATRVITAAVVSPLIFALLFWGPVWGFTALIWSAIALSSMEFFRMTHPGDRVAQGLGVLAAILVAVSAYLGTADTRVWISIAVGLPIFAIVLALIRLGDIASAAARMTASAFGPLWVGMLVFLAILRRDETHGAGYVLLAITFAWFADTGGYFAGRFLGRRKLYEAVSPKKTIAGLFGALAGACLAALLAHFAYLPDLPLTEGLALALTAGFLGQLGDLGESLLKRSTGIKDSGEIVPGHGGMLDRLDALFITSAIVYLDCVWR